MPAEHRGHSRSPWGKPRCLQPQSPPRPPNPPAPGFPRLRETFKSGLGRRRVVLISSGRSTPAPSRAICSAPRPTKGQGTRSPHGDPAPSRPQPRAQQGSGGAGDGVFPSASPGGQREHQVHSASGLLLCPKAAGDPKGSSLDLPGEGLGDATRMFTDGRPGAVTHKGPQNPVVGSARSMHEATKAQGTAWPRPLQAHGNGTGRLRKLQNHQEQSWARTGDGTRLLTPLCSPREGPA